MNPSIHPTHPTRPGTTRKTASVSSALSLISRCFHIFVKAMRAVREAVRFLLLMVKMLCYAVVLFLVVAGLYILLSKPVTLTGRPGRPSQHADTQSHASRSSLTGDSAVTRWTERSHQLHGSRKTTRDIDSRSTP